MNENRPTRPIGRGPLMTFFTRNQRSDAPRRNRFTSRFLEVRNQLGSDNPEILQPARRPLHGLMGTSDQERLNNAILASRTANRLILPKKFPGDEGKLFPLLINLCLNDAIARSQNQKRDNKRVSSLECYQYIQRNKNNLNHLASKFSHYSEDDIRLCPKSWLSLDIPVDSLAKCMSNYGSNHSAQHMEFLKEIGFTYDNMVNWMLDVLKKRCSLNIQSFERYTNNSFAVSYQIPVTPIKLDNKFKANQLSIKIVIAYSLKDSETFYKKGKLITVYLQNTKLQPYEKDCLLKKSPHAVHWGGDPSAARNFLNVLTDKGLSPVVVSPFFPILSTIRKEGVISPANAIEDYYKRFNIPFVDKTTFDGPKDIRVLVKDGAYYLQASNEFTEKSTFLMYLHTKFLENFDCN